MRAASTLSLAIVTCAIIAGCQNKSAEMQSEAMPPAAEPGVVNVKAIGLKFEAPDTISSGWTTFRFENTADVTHFAIIERVPEGIGIADQQEVVAPIFQQGMDFLIAGQPDSAFAAFGTIPEWFGQIVFIGGPGLTAPGLTSQTTVNMKPGNYLFECYVKTDGNFHSYNANPGKYGMVHQFTVTSDSNGIAPPTADIEMTLSSERGIEVDSVIAPGRHTIAVHFEDQMMYENFVGHDVHLVRLSDTTNMQQLAAWMNWMEPTGLQAPAPAEFLGGAEEMPSGNTEYFTVTMEPGRYAWISEVANPFEKGMLKTFVVAEQPAM